MSIQSVAVVTGAYRGLGLETCRQLAQKGYSVILTARRATQGQSAADALRQQGLDVSFHILDVLDEDSIQTLAADVQRDHGRLDVLVNNAGIFPCPGPEAGGESIFETDIESVRKGLETNALSVLRLCQLMIPLMDGEGRVVNVSSEMGQLSSERKGVCPGYRLSKTALNSVTRLFADELKDSGVKVNSVCPGWVRTDMGGPGAPLDVSEGVRGIIWAATLPPDGPSGGFFRNGEPLAW